MKSLLFAVLALSTLQLQAGTDVTTVGATGDGVSDDTAAIQEAINSGDSSLHFPKGIYRITETITIDLDSTRFAGLSGDGTATILMEGAGPAFHFVGTHEGTANPSTVKPEIWERQRTPMVSGIEILGANEEADGIQATKTMQLTLNAVVVRKCRHAVRLVERNRNVLISACHFYENTGIGVFLDKVNLHQINVVGSHISYCDGGGIVSHGGNVRNLHIGTCDIEGNHGKDRPATANIWLDSTDGSIGEVAITGCTIQHTSKAKDSANIRIEGGGSDPALARRAGREKTREGNITIGDNVFSDVQINIDIREARGVTITGNTFWEGFQRDIIVRDSSHVILTGNNFDRNPRYLVNGFKDAEKNGLLFENCSDCTLNGNLIAGVRDQKAAVEIRDSQRFNISNNSILDSDETGLLLENISRSIVTGNLVRDDRDEKRTDLPSIKVVGGSDNLIESNATR